MTLEIYEGEIVAVICEGKVEKLIIEKLLETDSLIFNDQQMLDQKVLFKSMRKAELFTEKYLTLGYKQKIKILIICDKESPFKIKKPYDHQVSEIIYVLTRPEIEMLMIHGLDFYEDFNRTNDKPSIFLKQQVGKHVKSENYVHQFYEQHDLLQCIKLYQENAPSGIGLYDLLKDDVKREIDRKS